HVRGEDDLRDGRSVAAQNASTKKGSVFEKKEPWTSTATGHARYFFFGAGVAGAGCAPVTGAVAGAVADGAGVSGIAGLLAPAGAEFAGGAPAGGVWNVWSSTDFGARPRVDASA